MVVELYCLIYHHIKYYFQGSSGWLKKRHGALENLSDLSKEEFERDRSHRCYAIPNTITIQVSVGVNMDNIAGALRTRLTQKGFMINSMVTGPEVYAVFFLGHFGGPFRADGENATDGPNEITKRTLHKIAFFAGVGCASDRGGWHKAIAFPSNKTIWQTDYEMSLQRAEQVGLSVRPVTVRESQSSAQSFMGRFQGDIGNKGTSLDLWIETIK